MTSEIQEPVSRYFPVGHPDETLHSHISRYRRIPGHRRAGIFGQHTLVIGATMKPLAKQDSNAVTRLKVKLKSIKPGDRTMQSKPLKLHLPPWFCISPSR